MTDQTCPLCGSPARALPISHVDLVACSDVECWLWSVRLPVSEWNRLSAAMFLAQAVADAETRHPGIAASILSTGKQAKS